MGVALFEAQIGRKATYAKPLKGYGGAGVLEVVDDFDGDAFRAVYTVRFTEVVYVLHAFQKKSRRGIATPKSEIELIRARLRRATEDYAQWLRGKRQSRSPRAVATSLPISDCPNPRKNWPRLSSPAAFGRSSSV